MRKTDYDKLTNRLLDWFTAKETRKNRCTVITVSMEFSKTYPMSVILRSINNYGDLTMRELGNFYIFENENVSEYNETYGASNLANFGNNKVSTTEDAFDLGMKYQQYANMLEHLGYKMISTVKSGLIYE